LLEVVLFATQGKRVQQMQMILVRKS